ncbi:hypothetical protein FB567DRAFT_531697 [Paraphoma chrysanthemicola]|uniref:Zn(2)-C6 fungal-type domain-containing protein n=1 Tax=Paraphoma chrysanthemicola TaxID=798071 RepID=A0A8K0QZS1_9PLEO|nr:hypothetical protein FB567DRAFT_531697 [Paraphoma chrysanthemicola]
MSDMMTIVSRPQTRVERKRRVHAKSRKGCKNCKIRRVKCGEERPHCKMCKSYGVECNYSGTDTALRIPSQGSFQIELTPTFISEDVLDFDITRAHDWTCNGQNQAVSRAISGTGLPSPPIEKSLSYTRPYQHATLLNNRHDHTNSAKFTTSPISRVSINSTITTMIDNSIQLSMNAESMQGSTTPFWHFTSHHLEIVARFRNRTALTIGDKSMAPAYRDCICSLAMTHAFLMHMLLSLTLMHDSHLTFHLPSRKTSHTHKTQALTHWTTATRLFTRLLSSPIPPAQRDAIWATGVIIGAASFWFVNSATDPWSVWPLKVTEKEDLNWLKLGEGKKMLWRVADPTRCDSVFYGLMKDKRSQCAEGPEWIYTTGAQDMKLPAKMKIIFDLDEKSTVQTNPYHLPLLVLSRIRHLHLTHANVISFLYVTAFLTPELLVLLEAKDARAVFVIGWWFKMIAEGDLWWITSRARIEGQAIKIWLELQDREYGLARLLDEMRLGRMEGEDVQLSLPRDTWGHEWEGDKGVCAEKMAYWDVRPRAAGVV